MATDREAPDQLTDEQRARVHDCLTKEGLLLSQDSFEQLIRCIETSIDNFLTTPIEGPFREAHDALRQLFELSHDEDPSVALLRNRVRALPTGAIKYIDGRAGMAGRTAEARSFAAPAGRSGSTRGRFPPLRLLADEPTRRCFPRVRQ
jgi:hypothetical protein